MEVSRNSEFNDPKGRLIRDGSAKQWRRDIVNRDTGGRPGISRPVMGVSMKDGVNSKTVDWLFQTTRSEEGKNFRIFSLQRGADWRVMQDRHSPICLQFNKRLLEANGVINRFLYELFNERLAPSV